MMQELKAFVKACVPMPLLKFIKEDYKYGFFGSYSSWEEAMSFSEGYDAENILDKVRYASRKVNSGEVAYERDSVTFDNIEYSFPVLAEILRAASQNQGNLSVLDFGGSLGSTYYQCRGFLTYLKSLRWSIVEQPNFVECGKQEFENKHIAFYYTINECLKAENPRVILLSGVLQYLESPYCFLKQILSYEFDSIIIDRTPFTLDQEERLTIQKVPPSIYLASYPTWFFERNSFLNTFSENYDLIAEFNSLAGRIKLHQPRTTAIDKGFILRRKKHEDN